ncbi:MAG: RHS repeat-associated core domain-containing protein [Cruoricaptor ignavus]|nr:RHS repeat-associated core domain-containing protein [Cruoricaptor ignavus]
MPYLFNGKELDQETNLTYYGARYLDMKTSLWLNVDPLVERTLQSYQYANNNPVRYIDPTGMMGEDAMVKPPHEYEVNLKTGEVKKVSDLGENEIDFYHYTGGGVQFDGRTRIVDRATGDAQWMSSSKNIKGYSHRDNDVNWKTLYNEFLDGNGPEKSLLIGKDSKAVSQMMDTMIYQDAVEYFIRTSTNEKVSYAASFGVTGAIRENTNMQGQFMGKTNFSFYPVGNNVVIMGFDSKSVSSHSLNPFNKGEERNISRVNGIGGKQSTTHQTYILWTKKTNLFK